MTQRLAPARAPGRATIFVAIAVTAFATGPCMLAVFAAFDLLFGSGTPFRHDMTIDRAPMIIGFVTAGALVGSIPAACLNAYLLNRAARNDMDAPWFSFLSGALMGVLVLVALGIALGWSMPRTPTQGMGVLGLFSATGACMGLLHWLIAIRPHRKWRKRLQYDVEAIRAME